MEDWSIGVAIGREKLVFGRETLLRLKTWAEALLKFKGSIFLHPFHHFNSIFYSICIGVAKLHVIGVGCNVPKLIVVSSLQ